jgi:hypothetical protein
VHAADGKLCFLNDFVHQQPLDERKVSSNDCPWSLKFTLCTQYTHNQNPNLTAWFTVLLVCDWLHSIEQNYFYVVILNKQGSCYFQSLHLSYMLQEDSV